MDKQSVPN